MSWASVWGDGLNEWLVWPNALEAATIFVFLKDMVRKEKGGGEISTSHHGIRMTLTHAAVINGFVRAAAERNMPEKRGSVTDTRIPMVFYTG